MMKKNELGFVEDPRYKDCEREAWYGAALGLVNLAIWAVGGYWLGSGPTEEYSYIMGFPAWFFVSCVANSALAIGGAIYIVKRKMRDMPLGPMTEDEAAEYEKAGAGS
ncbi:MAG: YhdT family protein [Synergistaceae bacterium]|nr:YhdT family protein [Synergistota bacterium]NLM70524.1 YhdT family protein [Synergistaceae bacterium]